MHAITISVSDYAICLSLSLSPPLSLPQDLPQYKGEVPDEDVHESNATGPAAPSAPPISSMDQVSGYEAVNLQAGK